MAGDDSDTPANDTPTSDTLVNLAMGLSPHLMLRMFAVSLNELATSAERRARNLTNLAKAMAKAAVLVDDVVDDGLDLRGHDIPGEMVRLSAWLLVFAATTWKDAAEMRTSAEMAVSLADEAEELGL